MSKRPTQRKSAANPLERLCTPEEAGEIFGIAPQTLAHWRVRGTGPRYLTLSARCVRYRVSDIEEWLGSRTKESTAENDKS